MNRTKSRDDRTLDLLAWEPPQLEQRFTFEDVRAASLPAAIAKAISLALKQCGKPREQVAQEMSEFLGAEVTKPMLDAYASEARESHNISAVRLIALVHVTKDRRLLSLLADQFGLAVVERRHLKIINAALAHEEADRLLRQARVWRAEAGR